jgi:signal transduction histidine kinase
MDGHASLTGESEFPETIGLGEPAGQADLFSTGQWFETLDRPPVERTAQRSVGTVGCPVAQSSNRNFFKGSCVPNVKSAERSGFIDNCLQAQENERLKLGRELHDSTGQLLLALRLEIARLRVVHGSLDQGSLLDEIEDTVREIDREIRAFTFAHYPAEVGRDGLGPALRSLARGFASRTGLSINFGAISDSIGQTGQSALALLRIAQEALLNVHRHARALHVQMALSMRGEMLELIIRDDGIGIPEGRDLEESHGVGLLGMRHRVERLGGQFKIRRLKNGTKIVAAVPV